MTTGSQNPQHPPPSHNRSSPHPPTLRRRPVPRRGHKKSRAGCGTCKSRKVKCDETTPECGPCARLGLGCWYPEQRVSPGSVSVSAPVPAGAPPVRSLRTAPVSFSSDDLRFFQHFLFTAYPSLPIGGWEVWQQVGRMSHDYEFLVHAILGLGASHLDLLSDADFSKPALNHRIQAIHALNSHLARTDLSADDADAAFAALLSLTFQSAYMPDGMTDFLCLIRGCFIVGLTVIPEMDVSAFKAFARVPYVAKIHELIGSDGSVSYLNSAIVQGFCSSLKRLAPLCKTVAELEYMSMMQRIADIAASNPVEGYREHSFIYDKLADLSPSDFTSMLDPSNHVSRLVTMHMLAIDFVMTRKEAEDTQDSSPAKKSYEGGKSSSTLLVWIEKVWRGLPDEYRVYGDWPRNLARALTFSFGTESGTWQPFLLHEGTARVLDMGLLESYTTATGEVCC